MNTESAVQDPQLVMLSQTATTPTMTDNAARPLNVTDALTYLDLVKNRFRERPEVYNQFLDIMKEFKGQTIDTPGVIQRVSMLFHGHSELIGGFNTFLPPGYRIEISSDPRQDVITVTTPMGVLMQMSDGSIGRLPQNPPSLQPPPVAIPSPAPPSNLQSLSVNASNLRPITPQSVTPARIPPPQQLSLPPFRDMSPPPNAMAAQTYSPSGLRAPAQTPNDAAVSILGNMSGRAGKDHLQSISSNFLSVGGPGQTGEFNHAIQYLKKIKLRYSDDQATYKTFLEILQAYQKEQRHSHDNPVYAQVQVLFKDAPDLLEEFKDFLPEALSTQLPPAGLVGVMPQQHGSWNPPPDTQQPEKPAKNINRRKKRAAEKEVPAKAAASRATKKQKYAHKSEPQSPSFTQYQVPPSPQMSNMNMHHPAYTVLHPSAQQSQHVHPHQHQQPHPLSTHAIQPSMAAYIPNGVPPAAQEELAFFDRAKKFLDQREAYDDFLKLLSLYTKDILGIKDLVLKVDELFNGDPDLCAQFRALIEWDDDRDGQGMGSIERGPPGSLRMGPPEALSAAPVDDGLGPSYRRCPDSELRLACSGRDELCRSVLNDEWVSHPTWASEESGFVAHKKNTYEEALHKSEEERHEYQVHLDSLVRTISIFEPLNARVEEMTNEERNSWRLKADFGGPSKWIYHKTIKKIYGRDSGAEVIQALQDCPGVAVPVVLTRLKQKEDDWRRAMREWGRMWKEVDAKNFYKSLDHQGLVFKSNDKKAITAKYFVNDVETVKLEQKERLEVELEGEEGERDARRNRSRRAKGRRSRRDRQQRKRVHGVFKSLGFQLDYSFTDTSVLHDCLKLVYSYLDHNPSQYSFQERRSVEKFLQSFIPAFCYLPVMEFSHGFEPMDEDPPLGPVSNEGEGKTTAGEISQDTGDNRISVKKVLTSEEPALSLPENKQTVKVTPCETWIRESVQSGTGGQEAGKTVISRRPFLANTTFYTLLRLIQLLYFRLNTCKEIGAKLAASNHKELASNPVAVQLGLDEPLGPPGVLKQAIETFGRGQPDENVLYLYLLDACEKVFENELDQGTFEEHMRWFFGTKAYYLFTLDKVAMAIIKQVQTIEADSKCQELWELLQWTRRQDNMTIHDIIAYRREAEQHVGSDENLYRFEWDARLKALRVQLISDEDASVDEDEGGIGRWREYVASYVTKHATEWISTSDGKKMSGSEPFLSRNLLSRGEDGTKIESDGDLAVRIVGGKYKILYEAGTEHTLRRVVGAAERAQLEQKARQRREERGQSRWLE